MKVALVHEMLVKMGGAERVLEVFQEMFPEAPIFTLLYDESVCGTVFPREKVQVSSLQKWVNFKIPRQFLVSKMPTAIESFDFSGFDLVLSSSSAFAHGILAPLMTKHISYIHSPMRYAWDYAHEYLREKSEGTFGGIKKIIIRNAVHKFRTWDFSASDRADLLLANSKTTQNRIQKYWRKDSEILYPPVDISRFEVTSSHENYFLILSTLTRYKQIELAIAVFNKLPKHRLIIIGEGEDRNRLERFVTGNNIEFLGRKSDADVAEFLKHCRALIFPGLEDFGIAPVEAMASGKPVIAFGKGGVTESVIPGKTGIFFPESTPKSLEKALLEFFQLEENGAFYPKECRKRAEEFSKEKFQQGIENVVRKIMS
ncbi:glycosyltransferase [Candidatus Peregrinibacteria bacterium]|nr:glycosyltransferase [Candidatus Peregrinibacteria bacterium]